MQHSGNPITQENFNFLVKTTKKGSTKTMKLTTSEGERFVRVMTCMTNGYNWTVKQDKIVMEKVTKIIGRAVKDACDSCTYMPIKLRPEQQMPSSDDFQF